MATCPQCGVTVGPTQRLCRACGCELDRVRSVGGRLGRFLRWLCGPVRLRIGTPRASLSVSVGGEDDEATQEGLAELDALPPELRDAADGGCRRAAGEGTVERVTAVGPVTVTRRTVTRLYRSLDEMPPELRQRAAAAMGSPGEHAAAKITVSINGQRHTYDRIDDVPEPYRQAILAAHAGRRPAGAAGESPRTPGAG